MNMTALLLSLLLFLYESHDRSKAADNDGTMTTA